MTDGWHTYHLEEVEDMFGKCEGLVSLSVKFNVSEVGSFARMFAGCTNLQGLDLSSFDAYPGNMDEMFKDCSNLKSLDISKMKTVGTSMYSTFNGCEYMNKLTVGKYFSLSDHSAANATFKDFGTAWKTQEDLKTNIDCPVSVWDNHLKIALASQYSDSEDRFYCSRKAVLPSAKDFHDVISAMVGYLSFINKVSFIYSNTPLPEENVEATYRRFFDYSGAPIFVSWNSTTGQITVRTPGEKYFLNKNAGSGPGTLDGMFASFTNMESIEGLELIDTREAISMEKMFYDCQKLESLNLSSFNTSNVTSMKEMFCGCKSLRNLDVSGFNTAKVISMCKMFCNCTKLQNIDLSNFNTSKTTHFWQMFEGCGGLQSLDLRNFDFSAAVNSIQESFSPTYCMFYGCTALGYLYLSPSFDPRGKIAGGSWHAIENNWGKLTFEDMGRYSSNLSYYTTIYCSDSQWNVIQQCLSANGQSTSKFQHLNLP